MGFRKELLACNPYINKEYNPKFANSFPILVFDSHRLNSSVRPIPHIAENRKNMGLDGSANPPKSTFKLLIPA